MVDKNIPEVLSRDAARARMLSNLEPTSLPAKFRGVDVEIRQPLVGELMTEQDAEIPTPMIVRILLNHVYLPGTNEKVFEAADRDTLIKLPFDADCVAIVNAYAKLAGTSFSSTAPVAG